ncbi:MAG TPA: DUF2252 domain-containing protein [Acidimicrobiales bacterium]|jgi:uncharacterized protein (DUF2252 family)|nr:DUF2252 domain-containing protein [Acidimicrobiales bacterium]
MAVDEVVRLADNPLPRLVPHLSEAERKAKGKQARTKVPRDHHARFEPNADRPDPVALLESQAPSRVPELVPIRYGRMLVSPFTFFRGAALVMASDLATTPRSGLNAQICGDAHLSNFGIFGSPERQLVFDCNDFDETLPGPWEWDIKRLAASIEVAARNVGFSKANRLEAIIRLGQRYREVMRMMAGLSNLEVWYSNVEIQGLIDALKQHATTTGSKDETHMAAVASKTTSKALTKDSMRALNKLTRVVDGERRIISEPPLIVPIDELFPGDEMEQHVDVFREVIRKYRQSLPTDRKHLLEQYKFSQLARKVVGVGSVGTRCWIILMHGPRHDDVLFLQAKEAEASVLERFTKKSAYANHGARVVAGQRLMQASSDIMLGWQRTGGIDGVPRDYYVRQLQDWKGSIDPDTAIPEGMKVYGELCAHTLARAHARSGDRMAIASYLGNNASFEKALARFAESYADQNERDYEAFAAACKSGRLHAEEGI